MSQNFSLQNKMSVHFESVRNLKARYFRNLDGKFWKKLREVFTADALFEGFPFSAAGPDDFVSNVSDYFTDVDSIHQGHMPLIQALDEKTIRASWTMHDYLIWPRDSRPYRGVSIPGLTGIHGYGIYEDEYKFVDNEWQISRMRLVRTRVELITEELNLLPLEGAEALPDNHLD